MCGIFKASTKDIFNKQFEANLERGASSFGGLFIGGDNITITKTTYTKAPPRLHASLYLGHLRAPTGDCREFSSIHSHPFEYGEWIVAHNGILTNFNDLKMSMPSSLGFEGNQFQIDSSVIPYYIHAYGFSAFEKFKGTWACWMYNKATKELFVTRSDNTLFIDVRNGDFSSKQLENYTPLPERKIFKIKGDNASHYEEIHSYNTKPLYFIP
jgi:glucosamine 6-phosphate synthetase-like amidotransferase/phosphosugar isomerase protein